VKTTPKHTSPGRAEGATFRPNLGRQLGLAAAALAAIVVGYLLITMVRAPEQAKKTSPTEVADASTEHTSPEPWYKKQSPPPELITVPDAPLFPEAEEEEIALPDKRLAYEEALPRDVFEQQPQFTQAQPLAPIVKPKPGQETPEQLAAVVPAIPGQLPTWLVNAVAAPDTGGKPMIALVIDDMGVDRKRSTRIIDLKGQMTLSFLTYARDLAEQTGRARKLGHELMLHVSMEPGSKAVDPGPNALLTELSEIEIRRRLEWGMGRFKGYVGINNHMGSKFTSDEKSMRIVIEEIKRRGLLFLDSRTSGRTVGIKLAREMGVPHANRNVFIDHVNEIDSVNTQLHQVEAVARRQGYVVAIGHPREVTLKALGPWLKTVEGRGFKLVPLTTIVRRYGVGP